MPDVLSPEQRHRNMAAIHSASTKPELKLRHALWQMGFRYRVNDRRLPGSPDIALPKYRTVIFVHGCFWHGHKDCRLFSVPKTNPEFWTAKITRNQERDQKVWRQLEAKGWSVIIVWECRLKKTCSKTLFPLLRRKYSVMDRFFSLIRTTGERHGKSIFTNAAKEKSTKRN
jgi:DNA mismatch endonuclease (patch repair protein)